jgi:hypothetical protein
MKGIEQEQEDRYKNNDVTKILQDIQNIVNVVSSVKNKELAVNGNADKKRNLLRKIIQFNSQDLFKKVWKYVNNSLLNN